MPDRVRGSASTGWMAHPTTYHHLVHERGWSTDLTVTTVIATLERELIRSRVWTPSARSAASAP